MGPIFLGSHQWCLITGEKRMFFLAGSIRKTSEKNPVEPRLCYLLIPKPLVRVAGDSLGHVSTFGPG